ncbi:MAG: hypothetical protein K0S99_2446, partial [Thermomicrobiales bacterium]|nr:hypothetical protein [Thermomicrobiales bacterium]
MTAGSPTSRRGLSAVHNEQRPGDEAGLITRQKEDAGGDLLWLGVAAQGDCRERHLPRIGWSEDGLGQARA